MPKKSAAWKAAKNARIAKRWDDPAVRERREAQERRERHAAARAAADETLAAADRLRAVRMAAVVSIRKASK